ncbi:cyclodeaminase/cyclohydrolase family protein [Sphingomonas solaris]|uniref:Cyclodeaminase/cyclohydrolase domain-containing protein n=1 Tax=Alterirhizorhabdus solaris TaxID=2529389 RepID=A0A558RBW3_9SPHN|nr:cyclodeaminase/cyclohydrolase family protein [Sphingomonas solaris]TVV76841.1 hypothetical protein FOY91_02970 [Sphingomonas solaris]
MSRPASRLATGGGAAIPGRMPAPPAIDHMDLPALLAAIASTEPAPGAGAAGAVALALGVACARKALRISARHHPADASLRAADTHLVTLGEEALAQGQGDARDFTALLEAMRLPHHDAAGHAARTAAIDRATAALRDTTERLVGLCDAATLRLEGVAARAEGIVTGDVDAARALIAAARAIHAANLAELDQARG